MSKNILITGGCGFIGSHLADSLISAGNQVRILDSILPQVHATTKPPAYLNPKAQLIVGDVRDAKVLTEALDGIEVIFHFASLTGVAQSMYEVQDYLDVNVSGTATLLQYLAQNKHSVQRLILSSSRAVYGEGAYNCPQCGSIAPTPRPVSQLREGKWQIRCLICNQSLSAVPTGEDKPTHPSSLYAVSKLTQEQSCLLIGETYDVPTVILRFFNVYGSRQSLENPYTGVLGFFMTQIKHGKPPQLYEDGLPSRDFVHVSDVVQACLLAIDRKEAISQVINVGSGQRVSLLDIASVISQAMGGEAPILTHKFRAGDVRHCFADITKARTLLGYKPQISFKDGIYDLVELTKDVSWADRSAEAERALRRRKLT